MSVYLWYVHIHANMHYLLNKLFFYSQRKCWEGRSKHVNKILTQIRCSVIFLMTVNTRTLQTMLITPWILFESRGWTHHPTLSMASSNTAFHRGRHQSYYAVSTLRKQSTEVWLKQLVDSGLFMLKMPKFTIQGNGFYSLSCCSTDTQLSRLCSGLLSRLLTRECQDW